jgi:predicted MPP superfamily phosphohydrolase
MGEILRIAIISDIHCHKRRKSQSSFLLTDTPKKPAKQNPLASLNDLIDRTGMKADILILPGDFCDQIDEDGFNFIWSELQRVAKRLDVKDIIPTIGNHDVNSRSAGHDDIFRFAKNMDPEFPFKEERDSNKFWTDGFVIRKFPRFDLNLLIMNSAHHHYSLPQARKGLIDDAQREKIELELKNTSPAKFNIAVSHHHPIPHEERLGGSTDLIENASLLLDLLAANKFQFYIHGHKHDARLKYSNHGPDSMLVFAAGSFARHPYPSLSGVLNAFHVINIENQSVQNCSNQGFIETYFFAVSQGFQAINTQTFPHLAGFGYMHPIKTLVNEIYNWLQAFRGQDPQSETVIKPWAELLQAIPETKYLTPTQLESLINECDTLGIRFYFDKNKINDGMVMHKL